LLAKLKEHPMPDRRADVDTAIPAALTVDGVQPIPPALAEALRPYSSVRSATALSWNPVDRTLLIATRFGSTLQLHQVAQPMGARRQLTFEPERIVDARWAPSGDVLVAMKDVGGGEFYQLYAVEGPRLTLITDGKSRNLFGAFSPDGRIMGYTSTRRDGASGDLYVVDPRDPATDRRVAEVVGGGWGFDAFAPDGRRALIGNAVSFSAHRSLYWLDLDSGAITPLTDPAAEVLWRGAKIADDGTIWVLSDLDSDVMRLGTLDGVTGAFQPVAPTGRWGVEAFSIARDGRFVAYAVNEAGISRLHLLDVASGADRVVEALPTGVLVSLRVARWGAVAVTLSSPRITSDVFVVDPETLAVERWTESETGGLDPAANADAELIEVASFDGEPVSGFLYRPDAGRFPGRRPLIFNIHGGPEGQSRPVYKSNLVNYLINELGVAVFYPNVRGSTGFGKRFGALDNGPFRREDTVKDIGAFLGVLAARADVDPARIGVTGGSYGGYMTLASLVHYPQAFRAAIETVGISNFVTFLERTEAYRRDLRRVKYGDERDPQQRPKLIDISPLTHADKIKAPLMVLTGANDPRVPASEAEQIITAVRSHGVPVWSVLAANEGHGFARKENIDYASLAQLVFWQTLLLN
jgi:dipeptidyl aminopeptidase/acylaminoacyl peptidase